MTRVDFYAMNKSPAEFMVAKLVIKALDEGNKLLVRLENPVYAASFDNYLWTFDPNLFVPHTLDSDPLAGQQKVVVSGGLASSPHAADILVILNRGELEDFANFSRVLWVFSDFDEDIKESVANFRDFAVGAGAEVKTWRQNAKGGFVAE